MSAHSVADRVAALRAELWDAEYRPIALYSWNVDWLPLRDRGKRPKGDEWQARARRDPPEAVEAPVESDAINTGILCDRLRVPDIDVDESSIVANLRALAISRFGETVMRYRENSPRCLLVYQASESEPAKRQIVGKLGKVEILGRGQQFAAYGRHPSGALLRLAPESLVQTACHTLPTITEDQITNFFAAAMPLIGATKEKNEGAGMRAEDPAELRTLLQALCESGAERIARPDDLPDELRTQLAVALAASERLRRRWAGDVSDLRASGRDLSRSGQDFSFAALLKGAGFTPASVAACLLAFDHGSAFDESKHASASARIRYVARSALRAATSPARSGAERKAPDPRRKETTRTAFRLLRAGVSGSDVLATLHWQNLQRAEPLAPEVIGASALWAARQLKGGADA